MSASDLLSFAALIPAFKPPFRRLCAGACAAVMCSVSPLVHAQRIDALPQPAAAPLDLGAIAQGFSSTDTKLPRQEDPRLRIFASLSMPQSTLSRLAMQAEHSGGVLVLRGLHDGSLTRTVAKLHEVFGDRIPNLQIDPQGFDRYRVEQVPTFVLSKDSPPGTEEHSTCQATTCTRTSFVKVTGDVSLDYALGLMRQSPAFAPTTRALLDQMASRQIPQRRTP